MIRFYRHIEIVGKFNSLLQAYKIFVFGVLHLSNVASHKLEKDGRKNYADSPLLAVLYI